MHYTPGAGARPEPPDDDDDSKYRLFLFVDPADVEAAKRLGLNADDFRTPVDVTHMDVFIVAPRTHLYASEQAHQVAESVYRRNARTVKIVDVPVGKAPTMAAWLVDEEDAACLNVEADAARDWHPSAPGPVGERPTITITEEEKAFNDRVLHALSRDPDLYRFGPQLVTIFDEGEPPRGMEYHGTSPPRIWAVSLPSLRERITSRVKIMRLDSKGEEVPAHPPNWCVSAIHARAIYPEIRPLRRIVQAPTMRRDGSILDEPGYDPQTQVLYRPNAKFDPIPRQPSRDDAMDAAALLLDLLRDFPLRGAADRVHWLAVLLTALARTSFEGSAPLFGFDGNVPGAGKTLLADLVSILATGRPIGTMAFPSGRNGNEELEKRITSIALVGEQMVLFDNIAEPLGGAALDAAVTSPMWSGRPLGRSEKIDIPLNVTWMATGNNLEVGSDMLRRVLFSRIEAVDERPEERSGFKYPALKVHASRNRGKLVAAALTILRAYHVAGRPSNLKPLGSFEGWTELIAGAVQWATGVDVLELRKDTQAVDPESAARAAIISGWSELPGSERGVTVGEALRLLKAPGHEGRFGTLRAALMELSPTSDLPSPHRVGSHLRRLRDRPVDGFALRERGKHREGGVLWAVESVDASAATPVGEGVGVPNLDNRKTLHLNGLNGNALRQVAEFAESVSVPRGGGGNGGQEGNCWGERRETNSAASANSAVEGVVTEREVFEL